MQGTGQQRDGHLPALRPSYQTWLLGEVWHRARLQRRVPHYRLGCTRLGCAWLLLRPAFTMMRIAASKMAPNKRPGGDAGRRICLHLDVTGPALLRQGVRQTTIMNDYISAAANIPIGPPAAVRATQEQTHVLRSMMSGDATWIALKEAV